MQIYPGTGQETRTDGSCWPAAEWHTLEIAW